MWLALDASTYTGSVAVIDAGLVLASGAVPMRGAEEEHLMPAVVDAVEAAGGWSRLTRVLVGEGPGSFTSLRIAAAIAKGVATARQLELWAVPSLALLAADPALAPGEVVVALDAMRGEVFAQRYTRIAPGRIEALGPWTRVPLEQARREAALAGAQLGGVLCEAGHPPRPDASWMGTLVESGLAMRVDLDRWEPTYGRLAEAQVAWEARHGRPLGSA